MRLTSLALTAAALSATLPAHAAAMPTLEQIHAAVQAGVAKTQAKTRSSIPMAVKVTSLAGCQDSQEVPGEVVCLVGLSAGMRDGFTVLPLRQDAGTWTGVERKHAVFPGPTPEQAQAAMHAWAEHELATNAEAAKDEQIKAAPGMGVQTVEDCEVERKTGYLQCDTTLIIPGRANVKTDFRFELDGADWRFVPRR